MNILTRLKDVLGGERRQPAPKSSAAEGGESVLEGFPRGDPDKTEKEYSAPAESFARPSRVAGHKDFGYTTGKLFLGLIDASIEEDKQGDLYAVGGMHIGIADNRHMLTVAGTRAGKGRSAIMPNMLLYPGSILATDPKGELATMTARRRAQMGQDVHVLDPFKIAQGEAVKFRRSFNPIAVMRDDSLIEDAALIADALVVSGGHDPHWDESARVLIEGVILHVRTAASYKNKGTLTTVRQLISRGARTEDGNQSMQGLEAAMRGNGAAGGSIQAAAADFFDRPPNERGSVLSTARRQLKFLDYPGIRDVVRTHDFDLSALKKRATTIYLCLPARHIGTCSRWLRLFVNLTLQSMEEIRTPPATGRPVLCCLDEFASLGKMQQIEDAAGQIAGFGVKLWPILQDLGQLKSLYGDRWETFMGNAGVLQFFGNNDLTTLEWISKRCDKTSIRSRRDSSIANSQERGGASGENWATEIYDLVTPGEAARLFGRDDPLLRQLVIVAGRPPIVLQRAFYDKHHLFRDDQGREMFDPIPDLPKAAAP